MVELGGGCLARACELCSPSYSFAQKFADNQNSLGWYLEPFLINPKCIFPAFIHKVFLPSCPKRTLFHSFARQAQSWVSFSYAWFLSFISFLKHVFWFSYIVTIKLLFIVYGAHLLRCQIHSKKWRKLAEINVSLDKCAHLGYLLWPTWNHTTFSAFYLFYL